MLGQVDWRSLVRDLRREGHMRDIDIATAVGRSESWVSQLARGLINEPPHSVGQALLALAAEFCVSRGNWTKTQDPEVGEKKSA